MLLKYGEHNQLIEKRVHPSDYNDQRTFALDWQCAHLLSKSTVLGTFDPKTAAFQKYLEAEEKCAETNKRILDGDLATALCLDGVRRWCVSILGRLSDADLRFTENSMRFGPGSTTSQSNGPTYSRKVDTQELDVSPRLLPLIVRCFPDLWMQQKPNFRVRRTSKGVTVPKNSKTDRCIEIQPDLNIFYQLGVGRLLRSRLLRYGVDLTDQSLNQELARRGSIDGSLATIDLSSASDTISCSLVRSVIPDRWLHLLELGRVDLAEWPDRTVLLEKWSAMGNGYTFELETLIFYAALLSVCDRMGYGHDAVSAYGDDLIFPSEFYEEVVQTLKLCGFDVNLKKSFGKGYFRESCGADYWNGFNVRPAFFNACPTDDHFYEICTNYGNKVRAWASRLGDAVACDAVALPCWIRLFTACPERYRVKVPLGTDGGFHSNFDEARPSLPEAFRARGWGGYSFRRIVRGSLRRPISKNTLPVYISRLAGQCSKVEFEDHEVVPRKRGKPCSQFGYTLAWPNIGPWV